MIQVANLEEIIKYGKALMDISSVKEMYLTECTGCCSGSNKFGQDSSYRLFASDGLYESGIPKFRDLLSKGTLHPDSYDNESIMVAKVYNQQIRIADMIAKEISFCRGEAINVSGQENIPKGAIIWKLK